MSDHLPTVKRFITGHNADGLSIFPSSISHDPPVRDLYGMNIIFCYATSQFPVQIDQERDLLVYQHLVENPPGIVIADGSAFRIVDFPPAYTSPMHRSLSINYNVVIEGEVEVLLDSGEARTLKRGDSIVQRAINHAWRNTSDSKWARIVAIVIPAEGFAVAGKVLEADDS